MEFGRVFTAMATPFDTEGRVDYRQAQYLAEYLLNHGSDGLVISGTTGESPTLSTEEKYWLFAAVREAASGKGLVVAGTSNYDTASSVELSKKAAAQGVDAILAVTPYYNKPPQEGLYRHFAAIAQAVELPVILYNVPSRTNVNLLPETVARLAEINNIVGLKESSGNMDQMSEIARRLPDDFLIYSGDDSLTLPMLALGAYGVISVAAHLIGPQIRRMVQAFVAGDIKEATELHLRYFPIFRKLFLTTSPVPLKYCLKSIGLDAGDCRLPLCAPEDAIRAELDAMIDEFALLL